MTVLTYIFAFFAILGIIDKITGDKFELGKEFEKGIMTLGTLSIAMIGMITLSPLISKWLSPIATAFSKLIHIDPSTIIGIIFTNDSGGAILAESFALSPDWGAYNGYITCSMLGVTMTFTVPIALKMIPKEFQSDAITGILCGIITIPIGLIFGAVILSLPLVEVFYNLIPIIAVSVLIFILLLKIPKITIRVFGIIGKIILTIILAGFGIAIFEYLTKIDIPIITPIEESFSIVLNISIVLSGVFPLIFIISKLFKKLFIKIGNKAKINETSVFGIVTSFVNSIPTFENIKNMDKKGRILNMAFAVSGAFVFGDHLAFTMSVKPEYVTAMVVSKLISAISALILAGIIIRKDKI